MPTALHATVSDAAVHASGERWYVVQTVPRAEALALDHLERQGYAVFCPRLRKTVRHARQSKAVLAPLFPGYLFVRFDVGRTARRAINGTRGVVRPLLLPDDLVAQLVARVQADGAVAWAPRFAVGQAVRVVHGSFADWSARWRRSTGRAASGSFWICSDGRLRSNCGPTC